MRNLLLLLYGLTLFGFCSLANTSEAEAQTTRPPIMPIVIVKDIIRDDSGDTNNPFPVTGDHWQAEIIRDNQGRTRTTWSDQPIVIIDIPITGQRYILNTATQTYVPFNLSPVAPRSATTCQTVTVNRSDYGLEQVIDGVKANHSQYMVDFDNSSCNHPNSSWRVDIWRSDSLQSVVMIDVENTINNRRYSEVMLSEREPMPAEISSDNFTVPAGYTEVTMDHASIAVPMNINLRSALSPVIVTSYDAGDSYSMITSLPTSVPTNLNYTFVYDRANAVAPFDASARLGLAPKVSQWHFTDLMGDSERRTINFGAGLFRITNGTNYINSNRLIIFDSPDRE